MTSDLDLRLRTVDPLDPADENLFEQCVAVTIESARDQHGDFYTENSAAKGRRVVEPVAVHRGSRDLVAYNLRALRAEIPAVARVVTWNAAVNEPMLRVNRALGFVPESRRIEWQRALATG